MDFLTNNPLINLRGPEFLGVFTIVALAVIVIAWFRVRSMDATSHRPAPVVPQNIDPFEIAFMRGGYPEFVRLTILDLIVRGYLETRTHGTTTTFGVTPKPPDSKYLLPSARYVFDWMRRGRRLDEVMPGLPIQIQHSGVGTSMQQALESRSFLTTNAARREIKQRMWPFSAILMALAGYKLFVALVLRGRGNVIFLILLTFVALFILALVCQPGRLTALGRAYLQRVQSALFILRQRVQGLISTNQRDHLLLAVAAYGIGVLEGTTYSFFPTIFKKAATKRDDGGDSGGWSSCGSGCGSSCNSSSGSSCGSNCGGGGGCGGCGGGGD